MSTLDFVHLAFGMLLRLAVPLAVTLLFVLALRWLDKRWQRESLQEALGAAGKSLTLDTASCWDVFDCDSKRRENCPAFQNPDKPCWELIGHGSGLMECCRRCPFRLYRLAQLPAGRGG